MVKMSLKWFELRPREYNENFTLRQWLFPSFIFYTFGFT